MPPAGLSLISTIKTFSSTIKKVGLIPHRAVSILVQDALDFVGPDSHTSDVNISTID